MKYKFIKENGELLETDKLSSINKTLTWYKLNNLIHLWKFKKEEKQFLDKYNLDNSIFNVACLQNFNIVYLTEQDYKRIFNKK